MKTTSWAASKKGVTKRSAEATKRRVLMAMLVHVRRREGEGREKRRTARGFGRGGGATAFSLEGKGGEKRRAVSK